MRTTLDIANDVLQAAKERARRENKTTGDVISELARAALNAPLPARATTKLTAREPAAVYGFRPFPKRGGIVTNELIDKLAEDDLT
jgi:hypothetical protein